MKPKFDFGKRMERIRANMEKKGIDILVATRLSSVCYVLGTFIPYRAAVYVPLEALLKKFCFFNFLTILTNFLQFYNVNLKNF